MSFLTHHNIFVQLSVYAAELLLITVHFVNIKEICLFESKVIEYSKRRGEIA